MEVAILKKLNTIIQVGKMASEAIHACIKQSMKSQQSHTIEDSKEKYRTQLSPQECHMFIIIFSLPAFLFH